MLGVPLGIFSAVKPESYFGRFLTFFTKSGSFIPIFWLILIIQGLIFIINSNNFLFFEIPINFRYNQEFFTYNPITGFLLLDSVLTFNFSLLIDTLIHLFLPSIILALSLTMLIIHITKTSTLKIINQNYMLQAKNKGLSNQLIILNYFLPNLFDSLVDQSKVILANLIIGSLFIEILFNWPGIYKWGIDSFISFDLDGVIGIIIFFPITLIFIHLTIDILSNYRGKKYIIDPKSDLQLRSNYRTRKEDLLVANEK
ncbi:MAG: ABC transporter permease subunit [Candidatus Hodarchaeales archaeon]